MSNRLTIQLFGRFHLTHSTAAVDLAQRPRLQALLAYLILHPGAIARGEIGAAFWPDITEAAGRNRLRNLLHQLRQQLPDAERSIDAQSTTIAWRDDAPYEVDVTRFLSLLGAATSQADVEMRIATLTQAITLYQGALLPDCFDEWIGPKRARLQNALLRAHDDVISLAMDHRDWSIAQQYTEALLRYEPLNESIYRRLMRIQGEQGNLGAVMAIYRQCREILTQKQARTPSPETQALYNELTLGNKPSRF